MSRVLEGKHVMSIATASGHAVQAPAYEELIARGHALVAGFAERAAQCRVLGQHLNGGR